MTLTKQKSSQRLQHQDFSTRSFSSTGGITTVSVMSNQKKVSERSTTKIAFIRSIRTISSPIAELLRLQADGGIISTRVFWWSTQIALAIILIRLILTINIAITKPRFANASPLGKRDNKHRKSDWKQTLGRKIKTLQSNIQIFSFSFLFYYSFLLIRLSSLMSRKKPSCTYILKHHPQHF